MRMRMISRGLMTHALLTTVFCFCTAGGTVFADDRLAREFRTPPSDAKPRVWWHWMNGNVTEDSIRRDLEWMKRIGLGGVHNFDAAFERGSAFDTPQLVDNPAPYLSPEWRRRFRFAVELASELGLEFTIASSPGWSETGGPWVRPEQAMKKLVWSETRVQGGKPFKGRIAPPPDTTGLFQNIPFIDSGATEEIRRLKHYGDIATLAYRMPASELQSLEIESSVTSSAGPIEASLLSDGDLTRTLSIKSGTGKQSWIQFEFAEPQRIQAVTTVIARRAGASLLVNPLRDTGPEAWLEASTDGQAYRKIADLPRSGALQQTVAFIPTKGRFFRLVLQWPQPSSALSSQSQKTADSPEDFKVAELILHAAARVNRFEDKAGFASRQITAKDDTAPVSVADVVARSEIVDLSSLMQPDGSLRWTPPPGHWTILRFGYSLTGRINHPASRAGTGLEVDKLSREHVKSYMDAYLSHYEQALGTQLMGRRGLQYMLTDSYEANIQNWTEDMLEQFRARRGYDALPWLPVLAGRVVESASASDRFLWDFRKTLGELIADAHYGQISESLHARGMGRYGESHEFGRAFVGDGMEVKRTADIPMGATWAATRPGSALTRASMDADIRESASVAHIHGKTLVAAESFTAFGNTYGFAPQDLKRVADRAMSMGLNRFIIHTSVHQPDNRPGPGIGLGPFGQWFTRKETWAEQAGPWISYLARSCHLLQQGKFVADVAYFYGEDTNITALFHTDSVPVPEGYNFDFINARDLIHELSVKNGTLTTRSGMEYRLLALHGNSQRMSVPVLRKLHELVRAGAIIAGSRPIGTPSLADDEVEFHALVDELWGAPVSGERTVGSGKVFADVSLAEALHLVQIAPDVSVLNAEDSTLRFVHRKLSDGEIYFLNHEAAAPRQLQMSFRVAGKLPELWHAESGEITPVPYRMVESRTIVQLELQADDAAFLVFRQPTTAQSTDLHEPAVEEIVTLNGPWDVSFPPNLGAPTRMRFSELHSWTEAPDPGVRYFSGTATYSKNVRIPRHWRTPHSQILLDLGEVKNVAEVLVNGHSVGILWKTPFKIDITDALGSGKNRLEIKVTNLWPNRLVGDKQPGAQKFAFATFDPFDVDTPLLPSGLFGPVALIRVHTE